MRCVCGSTPPGMISFPSASISRAPGEAVRFCPISAMLPSRMRRSLWVRPAAVTISPCRMMISAGCCAPARITTPSARATAAARYRRGRVDTRRDRVTSCQRTCWTCLSERSRSAAGAAPRPQPTAPERRRTSAWSVSRRPWPPRSRAPRVDCSSAFGGSTIGMGPGRRVSAPSIAASFSCAVAAPAASRAFRSRPTASVISEVRSRIWISRSNCARRSSSVAAIRRSRVISNGCW